MSGLNLKPCDSYRLEDRFVCAKCADKPRLVKATNDQGTVTVTLNCHGDSTTLVFEKHDLISTKTVFD